MANEDWSKMVGLYKKDEISSIQIIRQESRETVLVNLVYFLHPRRGGMSIEHKILKNLLEKANFPQSPKNYFALKLNFRVEKTADSISSLNFKTIVLV